jgi:hypothetical protein
MTLNYHIFHVAQIITVLRGNQVKDVWSCTIEGNINPSERYAAKELYEKF